MIPLEHLALPAAVAAAVVDLESEVEVEKYADKGANGHLFFGQHRIMDRRVAVKFYHWAGDRSHDEPRLLSEIHSPHVIPIHAARFVDEEWAMFQTSYYSRGDLDRVIAKGQLSLHQAIDHTIEILVGVSALHGASFLHRDLKPENIFIDDQGRARIGDFGSVIRVPDDMKEAPGSGHSALYRPPESFEQGTYGRAGDIYQVGFVLYQLLGGDLPYDEHHWLDREGQKCWDSAADDFERSKCVDESIARRARKQGLLDLTSLPETVPESVRRVIRKAVRSNPDQRFAVTSQMIGALRSARSRCFDWLYDDGLVTTVGPDRQLRLVRERVGSESYRAECDKGSGWRKVQGLSAGPLGDVARAVEDQFC